MDPERFSGYNKLKRVEKCIDKALNFIGKEINLETANFETLEKFATITRAEHLLRKRESTINLNVDLYVSHLLIKLIDNRPKVTGTLTKSRLFILLNNTWHGKRMITKSDLYLMFKTTFPHCFDYDPNDSSYVNTDKLIRMLSMAAPPITYIKMADEPVNLLILFSCLTFLAGVLYGLSFV